MKMPPSTVSDAKSFASSRFELGLEGGNFFFGVFTPVTFVEEASLDDLQ